MAKGSLRTGKNLHYVEKSKQGVLDPYASIKGLKEPAVCPVCHVIYHKKRWVWDDKRLKEVKTDKNVHYVKCPACRKIEDKFALGKVYLTGSFVQEHFEELISLVKSAEKHGMDENPLERLIKLEKTKDGIYAETTSDALAMRIGHHLKRAYKGSDEDFKFSPGTKFVEIRWHRDLKSERGV